MRLSDNSILVRSTADGHTFREGAHRLVASHPVLHSVLATTLDHAIARPADYPGARWYWATRGRGRWLAVAMHTPPRPFHLVTSDAVLARAFAYRLREQGVHVDAVGGLVPGALGFAESWVDLGGAAAISVARREGLYDLPGPARMPKQAPPGSLRPATEDDIPLVDAWARGYSLDNNQPEPADGEMAALVHNGGMRLWEVDGTPVSMAYASRPHAGVSRISWVYTPPEHRKHGYGAAVVAHTAAEQKKAGHRVLLYTDLDRPATALYTRVGFRRIGDAAVLRLLDEEPVLRLGTNPLRKPRAVPAAVVAEKKARRAALAQMIKRARLTGRN